MATVNIREARAHFSKLLDRVAQLIPVPEKENKLTHAENMEGMRALRKRVKRGKMSIREMAAEGRRTFL